MALGKKTWIVYFLAKFLPLRASLMYDVSGSAYYTQQCSVGSILARRQSAAAAAVK